MAEAAERPPSGSEVVTPVEVPDWLPGVSSSVPGVAEQAEPYRAISLPAVASLGLASLYALLVSLGGLAIFWTRYPLALKVLTVLVPVLAMLGAVLARVRQPGRLAAIGCLTLAGLYAVLGLGSLVAFSSSNPWFLPEWTLLFPVVASLLAWFARLRIRSSEGTLSGTELTTWALGLSLFFGTLYAAYLASNQLAVRQQASDAARKWIHDIQKGELEKAFLFTLAPTSRPTEKGNLRSAIEAGWNAPPRPELPGSYSLFTESDYVRFLQHAGENARLDRGGAKVEFLGGGYKVQQTFHVATPLVEFALEVTLFGSEAATREGGGRQWEIRLTETGISHLSVTEKGKTLEQATRGAANFARGWLAHLQTGDYEAVYLDTLPPEERERESAVQARLLHPPQEPLFQGVAGGVGRAGKLFEEPAYQVFQRRVRAFQKAAPVVRAEPGVFWASDQKVAEDVVVQVKKAFEPPEVFSPKFRVEDVRFSLWTSEGNGVRVNQVVRIMVPHSEQGGPKYLVEGQVVVGTDVPEDRFTANGPWRILGLQLLRAHNAPEPPDGPGSRPSQPH